MTLLEDGKLIENLGRGKRPEALGLGRTEDGLVDLRGLRLAKVRPKAKFRVGAARFDYVPGRPVFERLNLESLDLSKAFLENALWQDCCFGHVRFDRSKGAGMNFGTSSLRDVSFTKADLRGVHWGQRSFDGPLIEDVRFVECDLRKSTYGHPLFRNCRWENCNPKGVDFYGSRFEKCTFVGLIDEVMFHGRSRDPDPTVASLRNPMRNVDFSRAVLKDVSFDDGIDLTSCAFPSEGYLRIPHPKKAYQRALRRVNETWSGEARDRALFYLEETIKFVPEDQPLDIIRPNDFLEGAFGRDLGRDVAANLVKLIEEASKE